MSIFSFNYRGLGNPSAVYSLRDLIRRKAPSIVFLLETKLSSMEFGKIRDCLGDFHDVAVDSVGRS